MTTLAIGQGFTEAERERAGALYWEAFGRKLRPAFGDSAAGAAQVTAALRADRMLVARSGGEVVGVCGYHHDGRGAADLSWSRLRQRLGAPAALRALLVLAPLDRPERPGVLVLDGICVAAAQRGRGVGSALLSAAGGWARRHHDEWVQLSVVDTNPRAEALYRRLGFRTVSEGSLGALGHVYGFQRFTTMRKRAAE
ncbi:GNAT superfamily N-acetyltransferase [Actinoplanes octamycinicus]|uniref:GNAT superfamily N-acetyltransferase n=1 Tax=Actinoplanes octamycinicus TaxID=135948 RepID=A0A7W7H485_9ACTN|nr:GNAT family N-acetyltransferase [Actinoplanes octamycinicus]MBB4743679.1 GNAT superfamily N-acetyltransferase [Actinoplanes octamycinicus]GIE61105.1 molybdopterin-guanine dinucleotide biosynthesis protein MobC [Actinoplanes octamycinicus]